jgi:hypothetical protein
LEVGARLQLPLPEPQWRAELLAAGLEEIAVDGAIAIRAAGVGACPATRSTA